MQEYDVALRSTSSSDEDGVLPPGEDAVLPEESELEGEPLDEEEEELDDAFGGEGVEE